MAAIATALIALLLNSSEVSPSLPAAQAVIQPDTSGDPCPVPAQGKLRSDAECDLTIRLINNSGGSRIFSISASGAVNALDESVFSPALPGNPAKTKLGECPCQVAVPGNTTAEYVLRVEVNDISPGWYTSTLEVHLLHTGGRLLHSFQLKIEEVNPQWDVQLSTDTLTIDEADDPKTSSTSENQATYSVSLTTAPTSDVIVSPVSSDTDVVTISASLTFTSVNWQTAQTVTVTAVNDDIDSASDRYTSIRHTVSGTGSQDVMVDDVAITVADDDTRGVSISATSLSVDEVDDPGTSGVQEHQATYEVTLTSEPVGGDVTIAAASGDPSVATAAPATLTFTSSDWSTPQTVTVSAVDDGTNTVAGRQTTIAHTVASTGDYSGVAADTLGVAVGTNRIDPCVADTNGDYDIDNDGLIEICNLAQLNAIRWDLNGDGVADVYPPDQHGHTGHDPDGATKIAAAFPNAASVMGCPTGGCKGYELSADLDFDTNGNGQADSGDEYWNGGEGWRPLMGGEGIYRAVDSSDAEGRFYDRTCVGNEGVQLCFTRGERPNPRARMYTAVFEGNGRTIANLYINIPDQSYAGLFGSIGPGAHVRHFGLTASNPDSKVVGFRNVGAVTGYVENADIRGVYSELDVSGHVQVGGLVGEARRFAWLMETYATGEVTTRYIAGGLVGALSRSSVGASYATGNVNMSELQTGGGLVGLLSRGHLRATYATGSIEQHHLGSIWEPPSTAQSSIGALVGRHVMPSNDRFMRANYATGRATSPYQRVLPRGLTGSCYWGQLTGLGQGNNYWDVDTSGRTAGLECGQGYTTAQLQAPTGYTGIYEHWNEYMGKATFLVHSPGYRPHQWKNILDNSPRDPWDFGTSTQYPVLKYCADKPGIDTADGQPYCPLQPDQQREPSAGQTGTAANPIVNVAATPLIQEGKSVRIVVAANPPPSADLAVTITITTIGDYGITAETRTVTIPSDGPYRTSLGTKKDQLDEADGTVTVTVNPGTGYTVSTTAGAAKTTIADAGAPRVSVTAKEAISEGEDATFTLTATPKPIANLDVTVAITTFGDFGVTPQSHTVTIPHTGTATLTVGTTDDDVAEYTGSVTATLESGTLYAISPNAGSAVVKINDDDGTLQTCDLPSDQVMVSEVEGWRDEYSHEAHVERWNRVLAALGEDTGESAMTADEARDIKSRIDNSRWDRTVRTLDAMEQCADSTNTTEPPSTPEVSISGGSGITEGGDATFAVTADPAPSADLDVTVTVSQTGDFGASTGAQTVTISTSGSATLTVGTSDDSVDEADGSITVTVSTGTGYTVSTTAGSASVAVADNDDPAPPSCDASTAIGWAKKAYDWHVAQGDQAALFWRILNTLGADNTPTKPSDVTDETVTASYVKTYSDGRGWSGWTSINEALKDCEASTATDEVVPPPPPPPPATPEVSISAGSDITEGGSATFTLTASPAPQAPLSVSVSVSQNGDVGVSTGSRTVTIPTTGSATLTVATSDDSVDEANGSVTATVNGGTGYTVSGTAVSASVSVADDDAAPQATPEISITAGAGVSEGGNASFTLTANPAPTSPLAVTVNVTQSGDYGVSTGSQTVTIPSSGSYTLTIATSDDSVDESDGSVTVTVNSGTGYTVSSTAGAATVAVSDDDDPPPPTPEVSISAGSGVGEGANASFTLTASPAPTSPLAVTVNVTQSGDYGVATGSQTVTIPTSGSYTLTIATSDDSTDESDGSVTVTVNTGTGYDVSSSNGSATVAISDDDPPAPKPVYTTPTLTISDASGTEGDTITFTVTLSPSRNGYVWVNYYSTPLYGERVSAGSGDFEGVYGMLTFKPGETEKTITVALTDDSKSEGTEAFGLRLYSEAQAQVAVREGIGTIIDND